jgi:L-iditol 2-dehydrogenase
MDIPKTMKAAVGETVDEFSVGDRVAVEAHLGCLRCKNCRVGSYTACLNYGNRKKWHRANGFTTNGGFAQHVINHINTVHRIPDNISFEEAALITNLGCVLYGFETVGG